ncbi:GDSL-type esterase/lipase family protein [Saccharibacillus sacchari]|uniref:GDSL-type esterase/lipase family protein n=1 Tax=Saccharibacillus sacchari TaxID=456493 RepID=A0ACC6PDR5_9BACL
MDKTRTNETAPRPKQRHDADGKKRSGLDGCAEKESNATFANESAALSGVGVAPFMSDRLAFHGAAELEPAPAGGVYIRRIPAAVRGRLNARGRVIAAESTGCELRFVTSSDTVDVTLGLPAQEGAVTVYRGGMFHSEHRLAAGSAAVLRLHAPPRLWHADGAKLSASGFAPDVWRVCFARGEAVFYGLDAFGEDVRPPRADEVPQARLLAYGSSITHGGEQSHSAYIAQTARRLGADLFNLGMSGSCLCERELIDWIARRGDWDILFLELGVNMRDRMDGGEFRAAIRYALDTLCEAHPGKPIFVTTIYPNFATLGGESPTASAKDGMFNEILREEARKRSDSFRLHLLEGDSILHEADGLSCDLVHPSDDGHIRMGEQLARQIAGTLERDTFFRSFRQR